MLRVPEVICLPFLFLKFLGVVACLQECLKKRGVRGTGTFLWCDGGLCDREAVIWTEEGNATACKRKHKTEYGYF